MSTSVICGCHDCCPSAPEISITQTVIEVDGIAGYFKDEYFTGPGPAFTLAEEPISAESVEVILNSGVQRQPDDFTVTDDIVTFAAALDATDKVHIRYFATAS
jgi:hypothetical protein